MEKPGQEIIEQLTERRQAARDEIARLRPLILRYEQEARSISGLLNLWQVAPEAPTVDDEPSPVPPAEPTSDLKDDSDEHELWLQSRKTRDRCLTCDAELSISGGKWCRSCYIKGESAKATRAEKARIATTQRHAVARRHDPDTDDVETSGSKRLAELQGRAPPPREKTAAQVMAEAVAGYAKANPTIPPPRADGGFRDTADDPQDLVGAVDTTGESYPS